MDKSDDEEEGILRRYLMQDSKVNSTLRVGVVMRQVEGDRQYYTCVSLSFASIVLLLTLADHP